MPRKASSSPSLSALRDEASAGVELATLADGVDRAKDFTFEQKFDGYRILAFKAGRDVQLVSRTHHDWTDRFRAVGDVVRGLGVGACVLDGEVCALDERGIPSFHRLQQWQSSADVRRSLVYIVFDLLHLEGIDLRRQPLEARRDALRALVAHAGVPRQLAFSNAVEGDPAEILREACAAGLEGIIAKRRGSLYRPGRQTDWLKVKCQKRQEFAIVGYLPLKNNDAAMGALLLGVAEGDGFVFAGRVGTGFSAKERVELAKRLEPDRVTKSVLKKPPRLPDARWVTPRLVAEVNFLEWTKDGIRHPSFLALRDDKRPEECRREST